MHEYTAYFIAQAAKTPYLLLEDKRVFIAVTIHYFIVKNTAQTIPA